MSTDPSAFRAIRWRALFTSLIVPLLVLVFFAAAPWWLDAKAHSQLSNAINDSSTLSAAEKTASIAALDKINFQTVCLASPPEFEELRAILQQAGISATFQRLRLGVLLSVALLTIMVGALASMSLLNRRAKRSRDDLIQSYRLSWKIGMAAAIAELFVLIPLMAYGSFELTVLLADRFYPQLLAAIIIGGLQQFSFWQSL